MLTRCRGTTYETVSGWTKLEMDIRGKLAVVARARLTNGERAKSFASTRHSFAGIRHPIIILCTYSH